MFINFKSLEAENCLSYEALKFTFQNGITIIDGWNDDGNTANAAGKSSIPDILTWTIYGKMPRDLTNPEILRSGADTGKSTIVFSDEFDNEYKIVRQISPNELTFFQNGVQVSKESKPALQSHIISLVGINYDIFIRTIYLPQGFGNKVLLMTDEGRKDILFKVVNLSDIDVAHGLVDNDLGIAKERLSVLDNQLGGKLKDVDESRLLIDAYREKADNFSKEKAKDLEVIDREIQGIDESIRAALGEQQEMERNAEHSDKIEDIVAKIKSKQAKLDRIIDLKEKRNLKLKDHSIMVNEKEDLEIEFANLESQDAPCPYCRRSLSNEVIELKIPIVRDQVEKKTQEIMDIEKDLINMEKVIVEYKPKYETEIRKLNDELNWRSDYHRNLSRVEEKRLLLTDRLNDLKKQRGKAISAENVYMGLVQQTKAKIGQLLEEIKDSQVDVKACTEDLKVLTHLKKIFGPQGFKSLILDGLINELNSATREYLDILYDQTVDINFSIVQYTSKTGHTETYKLPVTISIDGHEWPFNRLSGGEKRRAILAVDLAMSKIVARRYGNGCNVLILDEVTNDLDSYSREKFYELLQHMSLENRGLYLVDHNVPANVMKEFKTIKVIKSDGISRVIDGGV